MSARILRQQWRAAVELLDDGNDEAALIRAQHVGAVVKLVPALLLANGLNGAIVLAVFGPVSWPLALVWCAALAVVLAAMALGAWRWRRQPPPRLSRRVLPRAALHAAALAAVWGLVPLLWFAGAGVAEQVLLACILSGMLGGGAVVLATLPLSALAYVGVLALASLAALLRAPAGLHALTALLVLSYAATLVLGALSSARKSTALLRAQHEAARQRGFVSVLLQDFEAHAAEALWETGADGRLSHVSPRLSELLGVEVITLDRAPLLQLLASRSAGAGSVLGEALAAGRPFHGLQMEVGQGAGSRWWSISAKPLFDERGQAAGWRGVIADVSAEQRAQRRLRHLAHHDSLTGLANRLTLHERLREQLSAAPVGALLLIDLDHFKQVNDSLGHSTGDALLKVVAVRLSACVRPGDLVARLGGDEFAMLLKEACSPEQALQLAQRVVHALHEPCDTAGRALRVGASVGVALAPLHGSSADELFGHADMALYEAKEQGRGRAMVYAPRLGDRSRRRIDLEQGLRHAVERGELALHWQPQVDVHRWRMLGAEALLRWHHPQLGAVGPSEFIAVAERSGQILELGHWVLEEACRAAAGPLQGLSVSVNVSPAQLRDPHFAERVRALLLTHRLEPTRLSLEITESLFIDDAAGAFERLQALHGLGVRIALDDFGTGYSSLAYLRRFPFDTLKIDRAFVSELLQRSDAQAIVRTIAQLAGTLNMRTVAEGVETEAQLNAVQHSGCDQVQGFLISQPCAEAAFATLRQGWRGRPPAALSLH